MNIEVKNNEKILRLPKATLRLRSDGILHIRYVAEGVFDLEDCFDYEAGMIKICENIPRPVIVDTRNINQAYMTYAARDYIARSKKLARIGKCNAFLVNSFSNRIKVRAYVIINRPPCPAKIFSDEQAAIEWCKRFL